MTHDDIEIIGKNVKDMYGTFMGKVVGTITDIDGSIQSVGIDSGSQGLQQIQYEQLVVQGDVVIFIPKWRLDSQRLIREKQLTLRRLKALMDIVSENDEMKDDAQIIHEKYKSKLVTLSETQSEIKAKLEARLTELDDEIKSAKMLLFDAKVQTKSNEISSTTFDTVKSCTTTVIERITHETAEIANVKSRIADLDLEMQDITALPQPHNIQESAVSYLETPESQQQQQQQQQQQAVQSILPEAPTAPIDTPLAQVQVQTTPTSELPTESKVSAAFPEPPQQQVKSETLDEDSDDDWLARMEAQ